MVGALSVAGLATLGTGLANAAVPSFPDNIVVFPDRDFVTIEGYQDHLGETAVVEVKRAGVIIGSAQSTVGPGDVAFEVNHPGGVCWGAGTTHKVTPDIRPGDEVSLRFGLGEPDTTTTADAFVDSDATLSGTTLTVKGHIGAGVNQGQFEQRIINPDLVDTDVARRDIRAIPGPMTAAAKGGYASGVTFSGDTFTAVYEFDNAETAALAAKSGGERAMSWQNEDGDANRQGLTIAEHGELGGPGMGGCPVGPTDQAAPAGSYAFVRSTDKTKISVNWTPATPVAGAAAVTGYSVEAIAPANAQGVSTTLGARTSATGKNTTLNVDAATEYKLEVRSLAGARMSEAFPLAPTAGTNPLPADQTVPNLTFNPALGADGAVVEADSVSLGSENTADIYYTIGEDNPAITGGLPADNATLYTEAIPIKAETVLHAVAFDRAGNFREAVGTFKPSTVAAPLATPTNFKATAGQGQVKLDWSAVTGATSYQVAVSPAVTPAPASTTALSQTITGLTAGTEYTFTVQATDGTRTSAPTAGVKATPTKVTAKVAITSSRWRVGDLRISASSDTAGTLRYYKVAADGKSADKAQPVGGTVPQNLVAAAAPATGYTVDSRYRTNATSGTINPGTIVAVVTGTNGQEAGTSAPFAVLNG